MFLVLATAAPFPSTHHHLSDFDVVDLTAIAIAAASLVARSAREAELGHSDPNLLDQEAASVMVLLGELCHQS